MSLTAHRKRGALEVRFDPDHLATDPSALDVLLGDLAALSASAEWEPVHESRGARVYRGRLVPHGPLLYWKEFRWRRVVDRLKDRVRRSRAARAVEGGQLLEEHGYCAPRVVAFGEERHCGILARCFLVTAAVEAHHPLDLGGPERELDEVARALGRIHDAGLVHGDLKATNVMLADRGSSIVWLDNERTRRSGRTREQARNLVQLLVEDGGSEAQARRERFLATYGATRRLEPPRRKRLERQVEGWLAARHARRARRAATA